QSVIDHFDDQRKLGATAVFRLAECYRKQGKTNEAVARYQRVLQDFSDQATLAKLSRENLAVLAPNLDTRRADQQTAGEAVQRQKDLLEQELELVEKQLAAKQKQVEVGKANSEDLIPLQREILSLKRQMAALDRSRPDLVTLAPAQTSDESAASESAPGTDEEAKEIMRIKEMIRNSPDLINAKTGQWSYAPLHTAA